MDFEIGQNLDFLKLGQRRLGMSGMDMVDVKVFVLVPFDVWKCLGQFIGDLGQLPFDTFATDQPTDHFALS